MNVCVPCEPRPEPGDRRRRPSALAQIACSLLLTLSSAWAPQPVSARAPDDPLVTVSVFRNALIDGNVGTALALLSPDMLAYQAGAAEVSRHDYAQRQIRKDIAHLATYYVEEKSQKHDVQDDLAWVSTRLRLLGKSVEKPSEYFGTETVVLRRSAAGWLIVHRHWSDSAPADGGT